MTVSTWVNINEMPTQTVEIVSKSGNYSLACINGDVLFQMYLDSTTGAFAGTHWGTVKNATHLQIGRWYLLTGVRRGAKIHLFVDGTEVAEAQLTFSPPNNNAGFRVGYGGCGTYLKGIVDDVRLYDRALSTAEIETLSNESHFYAVPPCRLIDTRLANGPFGGPILGADQPREVTVADSCGVTAGVRSMYANFTVIGSTQSGYVVTYPAGGSENLSASAIYFSAGKVIAHGMTIVPSGNGVFTVVVRSTGSLPTDVHIIVDILGYRQ